MYLKNYSFDCKKPLTLNILKILVVRPLSVLLVNDERGTKKSM